MTWTDNWTLKDSKNMRSDELDALFKQAKKDSPRSYVMIVLAYNAALRVSELVHFRVSDLRPETGKISLIPLKKAGKRRIRQLDGSMKTVERPLPPPVDYPIPSFVMELALSYVRKSKLQPHDWLFPGRTKKSCNIAKLNCPGGHISKRQVQKIFDRICNKVKIKLPGRGIHSLKHARLTEVASKTKDPYLVREIGRHESVTMSNSYVRYVDLKERVEEIGGRK